MFEKIMASFQGKSPKRDEMKENARKLFGNEFETTSMEPVASLSAPSNEKMRMYKKGGKVEKMKCDMPKVIKGGSLTNLKIPKEKTKMKIANNHTKAEFKSGGSIISHLTHPKAGVKGGGIADQKSDLQPLKKKFAAGGVAKMRHDQATSKGMPKNPPRMAKGKSCK